MEITSERELAQLALIQPIVVSNHEQSTFQDYFKMLEKKLSENEIIQEFMVNILVLTNLMCDFFFHITTRKF